MTTRTIGLNRGISRLWLEGSVLSSNGFDNGLRYEVTTAYAGEKPCISLTLNPEGSRKVAGTAQRPIVDINGAKVLAGFSKGDVVEIIQSTDKKSLYIYHAI